MNRLVREHYPVSKLPEDLREGFEGRTEVTVTIDADAQRASAPQNNEPNAPSAPVKMLEELIAMRKGPFLTIEQIDEHLRDLRDEWD